MMLLGEKFRDYSEREWVMDCQRHVFIKCLFVVAICALLCSDLENHISPLPAEVFKVWLMGAEEGD